MGNKVNYNKYNSPKINIKSLKHIIAIIVIILLVILLAISVSKRYKKEFNNETLSSNNLNYNISTSSLEDVLRGFNVQLLNYSDSVDKITMYVRFDRSLFDEEKSNQNFFMNLSKYLAEYIDYKNFEFIDEQKDIDINVKCEKPNIIQFVVNGDSNYFQNKESEINAIKAKTEITQFSIQSNELKVLNQNRWIESSVSWGTRESLVDGYNIYFDEGIKYKNAATRVFNIVFTENYSSQVVGGLRPGATRDQVISSLGEPTFKNGSNNIYGYLGENNYVFFDFLNNEISCYPVKTILEQNENDFVEYVKQMNETGNIKDFATNVTSMWVDYDVYDFQNDYVLLKYTLRGITLSISSDSLENGLFIYQNYSGDRSIVDLDNVYMKAEDSVFLEDNKRMLDEQMSRADPGDYTDEYREKKLGLDFSVRFNNDSTRFYSRDKSYADSEFDRNITISSYMWLNGYIFVYSIDNDGIYAYNCQNRNTQQLLELNEKITINDIKNNTITYNDSKTIDVVIK